MFLVWLPFNSQGVLLDGRGVPVNGVLWVGEVDKDPVSYPVALFVGGLAVVNPVVVVNGVVPVLFSDVGAVSLLLLDRWERQVWFLGHVLLGGGVLIPSNGDPEPPPIDINPPPPIDVSPPPPPPPPLPDVIACKYVTWAGWFLLGDLEGLNDELPDADYVFRYLVSDESFDNLDVVNQKKYVSAGSSRELLEQVIAGSTPACVRLAGTNRAVACQPISIGSRRISSLEHDTYFGQSGYRLDRYGAYHYYKSGDRLVGVPMSGYGRVEVSVDFDYHLLGVGVSIPNPDRNFMSQVNVEGLEVYHVNYTTRVGDGGYGFKVLDYRKQVSDRYVDSYLAGDLTRDAKKSIRYGQVGRTSVVSLYFDKNKVLDRSFSLRNLFARDGTFEYKVVNARTVNDFSGVYNLGDDESLSVPIRLVFATYTFLVREDSEYYGLPDSVWDRDFVASGVDMCQKS